ncbi:3-oxoacyl-(acyl-carrier-protein) reductase [Isosphaera pallida ATCC 43644]|uniref:3-oxoacyl-[acyl-carrier-protein] reductase n=1 Tax=Isosphaera pallida (strain ATCC 43644 / DSM 9630 / IS1B) TaxID=575540 RepID=E8QYS0_ISOPI|nr:3-oxoacyl-[acyl-carrier-protein] reductase [Isosphaera pallida]ADV61046.1 3-oxoacyl-(acyl-carrier-protein) reductase [Isosphaera pallida ATCC 43644]
MSSAAETFQGCLVDLTGQTALVTGASRGIGRAIAHQLARCGANLALVARSEASLHSVIEEIAALGTPGKVQAFPGDVGKAEEIEAIVAKVEETMGGRIEILVNNAGITRDGLLLNMSDDQWDEVILVNLRSVFVFCRAVARLMLRQRYGRIVNVSSVSGVVGNAGQTNYSASKAGVIGFTKALSRELGKRKITANVVAPGFIATDMTERLPDDIKKMVKEKTSLQRMGEPSEIADAVTWLVGPGAGYVTGQVIVVDGGLT